MTDDAQTVRRGGRTFRFLTNGDGPAVVLVHGFPDTPQSFRTIAGAIADSGHRAVSPFLRGYHPDTVVAGRGYDQASIGDDLLMLLDSLDLDRAVLVGHDWGASAVYQAARIAPDRVRGLVPIAIPHPAALKPSPQLAWAVRHFWYFKAPLSDQRTRRNDFAYVDTLYQRWAPSWEGPARDAAVADAKAAFADPTVLHAALDYYRDLSLRPDGGSDFRIGCPSLLVVGGDDFTVDAYARSLDHFDGPAQVLTVPGAGHWPHLENADLFVEELIGFLKSL